VILVLVAANGFFSGAEIAIVTVRRARLVQLAEEGRRSARAVLALRDAPERFLATVQVGITVISATAAAFGGASVAEKLAEPLRTVGPLAAHADQLALGAVVVLVSYASIVLGELVPKSLAMRSAETYALAVGHILLALSQLGRPIVWLLTASSNLVLRPFGDHTTFTETRHSAEELQSLVEEAAQAGTLHPQAGEIASRAIQLSELRVLDLMIPRQEVVMLPLGETPNRLQKILTEHHYNRFPVFGEGPDDVVGYVTVKDLLPLAWKGHAVDLKAILRKPAFVPEARRAVDALDDMRRERRPFTIVVDEAGGFSGIVTFEDLVEELVGDIFSEHARDVPSLITREAYGRALVSGAATVRDVNRELGIELPIEGDFSTVAGLCLFLADGVPQVGARLALPGGTVLEIVDASARRVRQVRLHPGAEEPGA